MMNNQELRIRKVVEDKLNALNYPDSYRISNEICEYSKYNEREISNILNRLETGEPWEYICGFVEFDNNILTVTKDTLIPRIETLQILEICDSLITDDIRQLVDIGTGTGAIAISMKKRRPNLDVLALDLSQRALDIAKGNAISNDVSRIQFKHSDLLEGIEITKPTIVIANLPYIPTWDYLNLDSSVKNFEPRLALDGGKDGLDLIKKLITQTENNLNIKAVVLEIDPSQESILNEIQTRFTKEFILDFRGLLRFLKLNS